MSDDFKGAFKRKGDDEFSNDSPKRIKFDSEIQRKPTPYNNSSREKDELTFGKIFSEHVKGKLYQDPRDKSINANIIKLVSDNIINRNNTNQLFLSQNNPSVIQNNYSSERSEICNSTPNLYDNILYPDKEEPSCSSPKLQFSNENINNKIIDPNESSYQSDFNSYLNNGLRDNNCFRTNHLYSDLGDLPVQDGKNLIDVGNSAEEIEIKKENCFSLDYEFNKDDVVNVKCEYDKVFNNLRESENVLNSSFISENTEYPSFCPKIDRIFTTNKEAFESDFFFEEVQSSGESNQQFLVDSIKEPFLNDEIDPSEYYNECHVCSVSFNTKTDWLFHVQSAEHQKAFVNFKQQLGFPSLSNDSSLSPNADSTEVQEDKNQFLTASLPISYENIQGVQFHSRPKTKVQNSRKSSALDNCEFESSKCNSDNTSRHSNHNFLEMANSANTLEPVKYIPLNLLKRRAIICGKISNNSRGSHGPMKSDYKKSLISQADKFESDTNLPIILIPYRVKVKSSSSTNPKIIMMYMPHFDEKTSHAFIKESWSLPSDAWVGECIDPIQDDINVNFNVKEENYHQEIDVSRVMAPVNPYFSTAMSLFEKHKRKSLQKKDKNSKDFSVTEENPIVDSKSKSKLTMKDLESRKENPETFGMNENVYCKEIKTNENLSRKQWHTPENYSSKKVYLANNNINQKQKDLCKELSKNNSYSNIPRRNYQSLKDKYKQTNYHKETELRSKNCEVDSVFKDTSKKDKLHVNSKKCRSNYHKIEKPKLHKNNKKDSFPEEQLSKCKSFVESKLSDTKETKKKVNDNNYTSNDYFKKKNKVKYNSHKAKLKVNFFKKKQSLLYNHQNDIIAKKRKFTSKLEKDYVKSVDNNEYPIENKPLKTSHTTHIENKFCNSSNFEKNKPSIVRSSFILENNAYLEKLNTNCREQKYLQNNSNENSVGNIDSLEHKSQSKKNHDKDRVNDLFVHIGDKDQPNLEDEELECLEYCPGDSKGKQISNELRNDFSKRTQFVYTNSAKNQEDELYASGENFDEEENDFNYSEMSDYAKLLSEDLKEESVKEQIPGSGKHKSTSDESTNGKHSRNSTSFTKGSILSELPGSSNLNCNPAHELEFEASGSWEMQNNKQNNDVYSKLLDVNF